MSGDQPCPGGILEGPCGKTTEDLQPAKWPFGSWPHKEAHSLKHNLFSCRLDAYHKIRFMLWILYTASCQII